MSMGCLCLGELVCVASWKVADFASASGVPFGACRGTEEGQTALSTVEIPGRLGLCSLGTQVVCPLFGALGWGSP